MENNGTIKKLKESGFFDLAPLKQIEFLREHGFFKLDLEKSTWQCFFIFLELTTKYI